MNLESELKQKKFKTDEERAIVNIIYTAYRINNHLSCLLSPFRISIQQYNILRILRGQYPSCTSVNLLKDRMIDKNPGVSRLVEKLSLKGLVKRSENKTDRRQTDIKILPPGLKMLEEINHQILFLHRSAKILTPGQLSSLNWSLDQVRTNLY